MDQTTSSSLLDRLRAGDPAAWAEFVVTYRPAILRWLAARRVRPADADDILQELLLRLHQKLPLYDRTRGRFRHWLRTLLHRTLVNHFRAGRQTPGGTGRGGACDEQLLANLTAADSLDVLVRELDPLDHEADAARWEVVRGLIRPNDLACYLAVECHGQCVDDVAAAAGRTRQAVHQAVFRARKQIQAFRTGTGEGS